MHKRMLVIIVIFLIPALAFGKDIVRIPILKTSNSEFTNYKKEVLKAALEITKENFGDYSLYFIDSPLNVKRGLLAVKSGKNINTFMAIATPEWLQQTLAIKIPVRRGILSYRLLSIHKSQLAVFSNVDTVDDLKALMAGVKTDWVTTNVMQEHHFNLIEGPSHYALYNMLRAKRIEYIPRGVNEIYSELQNRKSSHPDLVIEPSIALYVPLPYYLFVSPNEPRLAKRLEQGLEMMIANGSLKKLFYRYHANEINKAGLSSRKVFNVNNSFLTKGTPILRKELWFEHDPKMNEVQR